MKKVILRLLIFDLNCHHNWGVVSSANKVEILYNLALVACKETHLKY